VIVATPSTAVFTAYRTAAVSPQMIVISNAGAGALTSLTATSGAAWLQATFMNGQSEANPTATLRLQPSIGTLTDGSYTTNVTVSSTTAGVAPRVIPVTLQVSAGPVAFKLEAVSSSSQGGSAGKPVSQPPSVIARASDNTPVPGVAVTFTVAGGGSISPTGVVLTNADGIAALTSWTLGTQPGASQTVTASSPGLAGSPLTFAATSLAASKLLKVSGDAQTTVLGGSLPQPVVVRVTDPNNVVVPNATVTFAVTAGGSVTPASATTDANGLASVSWTLGTTLGSQTLTASLIGPQGSPFVTFTANATGATDLQKVSGDGQQASAGSALPAPLRVRVTGANEQPVIGVTVTFQPNAGSGSATPTTATTDANGEASASWAMPTTTGPKALVASITTAAGVVNATFSATATAPPPSGIVIVDGDNQTGRGASALPRQIVARVVTTIGTGIPGATVTFTPATGAGQSFSPTTGTTDANGEVRTTWTLGSALGTYTATVASAGLPSRSISATANQLPPNVGIFTGGAAKVPSGAAPTVADQAVLAYSGPVSGEVPLSGGSFTTAALPAGTYTLSIISKSGAFPTTSVYGVVLAGGQTTSVGTISVAFAGTGTLRIAVHSCPVVGDANGTATVRLYPGVNSDGAVGAAYSWTIPLGNVNAVTSVGYGIYTMTITTQNNVNPSQVCALYKTSLAHSWAATDGTTTLPLIVLSNP
jgi:adhesin/invasin